MLRLLTGQRVPCPKCRGFLVPSEEYPGESHCLNCSRNWNSTDLNKCQPVTTQRTQDRPGYVMDHYDDLETMFCEQLAEHWPKSQDPMSDLFNVN